MILMANHSKMSTWSIKTKLRAWSVRLTFVNVITKTWVTCPNSESLVTLALVANLFVVANVSTGVGVLALVDVTRTLVRIISAVVLTVTEAVPFNAHTIFTSKKS